jgi:hypothetical protein
MMSLAVGSRSVSEGEAIEHSLLLLPPLSASTVQHHAMLCRCAWWKQWLEKVGRARGIEATVARHDQSPQSFLSFDIEEH